MDPISILTSVSAASRVALALSTTLFNFVQATRDVNQFVRALYGEVTSLIGTLDAIGNCVKTTDVGKEEHPEQHPELWRSVVTSLENCRGSVDNMCKTLQGVQKPSSNIAGQTLRVFKLNWKEDQIKTLRSQVQTHNTALQLALQMINVYLSAKAPRLVTHDLVPRIEILTDMIIQLSKIQELSIQQNRESHLYTQASKESSDIVSLMASANDILNEAQSVVAQSEGGSNQDSYLDLLERDFQDSLTITKEHQPDKPNGVVLDLHTVIENWIPAVSPVTIASHFDSSSITTRTQMTPTQSTCETRSVGGINLDSEAGDGSDEDDEIEFELLQGFLDRGFSAYKGGNWASAQNYFERALGASKLLPPAKFHHRNIDLREAQFKIALCAFQQSQHEEAEVQLFQFRTARTSTDEPKDDALRRIISIYLFAEICFQKKKLDEAYENCRKAHSRKRKLLGKETPWLETNSFNLLMKIAKAKGDDLAAEVYNAKELEYSTLSSSTDTNQAEPIYGTLELGNILRSRSAELNTQWKEPGLLARYEELVSRCRETPFLVLFCGSHHPSGAAIIPEFTNLSREFVPGTFAYYAGGQSLPPHFIIRRGFQEIFVSSNYHLWPEHGGGSMESRILDLRIALRDANYNNYRVKIAQ